MYLYQLLLITIMKQKISDIRGGGFKPLPYEVH